MRWHEITIHTREEITELIASGFHEMGAGGVTIEESGTLAKQRDTSFGQLYDTPLNDIPEGEAIVQAYFADPEDVEALVRQLEEHVRFVRDELDYDVGKATISVREVDEEDWAHSWKQYYKPMRVSDRLTIKPTWESYEPESADEMIIELDPGMAFGTGTHPTTSLCLRTLEREVEPGMELIDVGTGSGVLAIAAAKLGAARVLALDLDPVAVISATENVQLNGVGDRVAVMESDLLGVLRGAGLARGEDGEGAEKAADIGIRLPVKLVVANILAEVILLFVQDVYDVLESGGVYITSGIYKNKEEAVAQGLRQAGFDIERIERDQDWVAIVAKKR
ncbi:50S ribosomal protein L11 methyltransferase [Paenibacillus hodogayensis]|uniref:Ribosomal protein L11 methyltransferase n=1 Tax=Paenibacillus hodogayensis TaxID=279208 RepID=A0ABV5VQN5_9BACL